MEKGVAARELERKNDYQDRFGAEWDHEGGLTKVTALAHGGI